MREIVFILSYALVKLFVVGFTHPLLYSVSPSKGSELGLNARKKCRIIHQSY